MLNATINIIPLLQVVDRFSVKKDKTHKHTVLLVNFHVSLGKTGALNFSSNSLGNGE